MKKSLILFILGAVVFLLLFWVYLPPLTRYRELKQEENRLEQKLTEVEKQIDELRQERDLLKNDLAYVEKVIRDELGLVKPGEIIYKFVSKKDDQTGSVAEQLSEAPAPFEMQPKTPVNQAKAA